MLLIRLILIYRILSALCIYRSRKICYLIVLIKNVDCCGWGYKDSPFWYHCQDGLSFLLFSFLRVFSWKGAASSLRCSIAGTGFGFFVLIFFGSFFWAVFSGSLLRSIAGADLVSLCWFSLAHFSERCFLARCFAALRERDLVSLCWFSLVHFSEIRFSGSLLRSIAGTGFGFFVLIFFGSFFWAVFLGSLPWQHRRGKKCLFF